VADRIALSQPLVHLADPVLGHVVLVAAQGRLHSAAHHHDDHIIAVGHGRVMVEGHIQITDVGIVHDDLGLTALHSLDKASMAIGMSQAKPAGIMAIHAILHEEIIRTDDQRVRIKPGRQSGLARAGNTAEDIDLHNYLRIECAKQSKVSYFLDFVKVKLIDKIEHFSYNFRDLEL